MTLFLSVCAIASYDAYLGCAGPKYILRDFTTQNHQGPLQRWSGGEPRAYSMLAEAWYIYLSLIHI